VDTLYALRRIQHHRVSINGAAPLSGVIAMTAEHSQMLKASEGQNTKSITAT